MPIPGKKKRPVEKLKTPTVKKSTAKYQTSERSEWVCPDCLRVHRGFREMYCRNETCPGKTGNCNACQGSGNSSTGMKCRCCEGTGRYLKR